jgi:hypothetical protein
MSDLPEQHEDPAADAKSQREQRQRELWQAAAEWADPAKVARMLAHVEAQAAAIDDQGGDTRP